MMKQRWSVGVWLCLIAIPASTVMWRAIEPAAARMEEQCLQQQMSVVAWYRGESNAADSAGLSDGYTFGGLSFAPGKIGQAFRFDGVDDRVMIPGSDKLNVGESGGFTLEFWVNPATLSAGRAGIPLAEWNDGSGNAGAGVQLWLSLFCVGGCRETPGVLYANLVDTQGKSHILQTGTSTMKANEFQHLALTYDKATGGTRLYRNGEFEQGTFFENFTPMTNRALYLGNRPGSDQAVFNGLMDEVTIHNRWLSQDEVKTIFQAGAAGKCVPACTEQPSGLLAWYRAEGNGNDAAGLNAGQLKNGATTASGKIGQAFHLDGVDDYVEVADSPALKPARVTVEAWARFDSLDTPGASVPGLQYLVFKQNSRSTQFEGYALYKYRVEGVDRLVFGVASAGGTQASAVSKTPIVTGRFYHTVGTYDGSTLRIYVNGVLEAETPAGFPLNYGTHPIYIGASGGGFDGKFKGQIDEVSIYGRALNAQEVRSLFSAFATGKCQQAPPLGLASGANYVAPIAPESVVVAFGQKLSTATQTASTLPLPTTLAGTVVKIRDAMGNERNAPLFFVSPAQINCLLPKETASGTASVVVTAGDGSISAGNVEVAATAPGLFSADGSGAGVASGFALRVKPDGSTSFEAIARFDQAQNKTVAVPIDLGAPADQVFLVLYATGIRYHRGLSTISATVGSESAQVQYAGEQGSLTGLDQINLRLSRTLAGRGEVAVAVTVENKAANKLHVNIK